MKRILLSSVLLLVASVAARAQEPEVRLEFQDGLVTLTVKNALISDVLSEWERVGGTTVKGLERLPADRVTINLAGVHERTALDAVLGTSGYVSTLGVDIAPGKSLLKSIVVVPRSSAVAAPSPSDRPGVDMSIPESRIVYPGVSDNDGEYLRLLREAMPEQPAPKTDTLPMPEARFQYASPGGAESWLPVFEPAPEAEPDPKAKPEPKPKKPPSGN